MTDHLVWLGAAVGFREEQVEDFENRGKATRELLHAGQLELADAALAQPCTGPLQSLVDRFRALEEPQRDLLDTESAENLQREDDLRLARDLRIGTDEEHPELAIPHLVLQIDRVFRISLRRNFLRVVDAGAGASLAPER